MKKIDLSEDNIQKFKDMYYDGVSFKEIRECFNISNTTIDRWKKKYGIISNRNKYTLNSTDETKQKMEKIFMPQKYIPLIDDYNGNHKKYIFNESYFDLIDHQDKAYMIGLFLADGCIVNDNSAFTISLQIKDESILKSIKEKLEYTGNLHYIPLSQKNSNWQDQCKLYIYSKHMCRALNFYGIVPNKSLILEFPKNLERQYYKHLLRGYIDGDGNISKNTREREVRFVSTKEFCYSAKLLIENILNINCMVRKCKKNSTVYELSVIGGRQATIFLNWIYTDANLYLQRKYDIYKSIYINNSLSA